MADQPWTLDDAQRAVDAWINQWEEGYWPPLSNLARLTEEVGELARELNQAHGAKPPAKGEKSEATEHQRRIADEMGDILFVLITLANCLDVELDDALKGVLTKYDVRDAHRLTPKK